MPPFLLKSSFPGIGGCGVDDITRDGTPRPQSRGKASDSGQQSGPLHGPAMWGNVVARPRATSHAACSDAKGEDGGVKSGGGRQAGTLWGSTLTPTDEAAVSGTPGRGTKALCPMFWAGLSV